MGVKEPSLADFRENIQRCMRCGFCRALCPLWEFIGWETGSPRGRMQIIKALLEGRIEANDYVMDRIYKCTSCGYCLWRCPPGVNTVDAIMAARTYLVEKGHYPKVIDKVDAHVRENSSIYKLPKETRAEWIEYTGVEDVVKLKGKADLVYFVGCVTSLSGRVMDVAGAASLILDRLGRDWTILGNDEWCCGYSLILSGKREFVRSLAEHNVEMIRRVGAKTVVTTCPGCYRTLAYEYPRLVGDLGFEVYHASQLFRKMLGQVKARFKNDVNMFVTYHDPCDLGRLSEVYDAPRIVLSSIPGIKLVELPKNRSMTRCCGGGGMLKATNPDIALKLAVEKVEEAHAVGAEAIISACASCKQNIQDGIVEHKDTIQMLDLTEIVAKAMDLELT